MIGTDYTGGCKSNYHAITTTTVPEESSLTLTHVKDWLINFSVKHQSINRFHQKKKDKTTYDIEYLNAGLGHAQKWGGLNRFMGFHSYHFDY